MTILPTTHERREREVRGVTPSPFTDGVYSMAAKRRSGPTSINRITAAMVFRFNAGVVAVMRLVVICLSSLSCVALLLEGAVPARVFGTVITDLYRDPICQGTEISLFA